MMLDASTSHSEYLPEGSCSVFPFERSDIISALKTHRVQLFVLQVLIGV